MDRSRKATREGHEVTLQYATPQEAQLAQKLAEENLVQLQASIEQSKQTPAGANLFQQRVKLLGECLRIEGETASEYYAKLRHWHDRDLPQTKSPRHPPRQTGQ